MSTPATPVTVTTTYVELVARDRFRPAFLADPDLAVIPAREPSPDFYRFLYATAGRDYAWTDRSAWTDAQLLAYLSRPAVAVVPLYLRGTPVGYVELNADADEPGTEIAYLGVFPPYHGRGFGKHLLSVGVARAFDAGATRVWLHTCSLDGPHALANYLARGFVVYRTETEDQLVAAASS